MYGVIKEWFYHCIVKKYSFKALSVALAALTIMVIWSEMTFFNKKPVLSLFALFLDIFRGSYNYRIIEVPNTHCDLAEHTI
jgi:hypothetical protein